MHELVSVLIPLILIVAVAAIFLLIVERFSPDATVTTIIKWIVFALVLIAILSTNHRQIHDRRSQPAVCRIEQPYLVDASPLRAARSHG